MAAICWSDRALESTPHSLKQMFIDVTVSVRSKIKINRF